MPIANVHVRPHPRSVQEAWAIAVAYRLPFLILAAATALAVGYNCFFLRLVHEARGAGWAGSVAAEGLGASVPVGALASLVIGDLLFACMYCSFARAVFTCPGYVPAEPWRRAPQSDPERQQTLYQSWAAQRRAIQEQATAARERAAQAQLLYEQQQRAFWAYQAHLTAFSAPLLAPPSSTGAAHAPAGVASSVPTLITPPTQRLDVPPGRDTTHSLVGTPADAAVGAMVAAFTVAAGAAGASTQGTASHTATTGIDTHSRSASSASSSPAADESSSTTLTGASPGNSAAAPDAAAAAGGVLTQRGAHPPCEVAIASLTAQALRRLPRHAAAAEPAEVGNPHWVSEYEADGSLRFCAVCHLYKPDGSHHCRLCHCCVLNMDHHCHFLNNCVGRRNYKFFFLCIFYSMLCGTVNTALLLHAYLWHPVCRGWGHEWWWVPVGMFGIGAVVAYLWLQHVFLLVRGVSTLDRMTEVTAERFVERVTGARLTTCARPGTCAADCGMTIGECFFTAARQCAGTRVAHPREGGAVPSRPPASSQEASLLRMDGNAGLGPAAASQQLPSTRAERRARRWALLFGQPRFWVCHLLPLAPVEGPPRSAV